MKKLLTIALAALSMSAFAITKEEALASKNYETIDSYCKTNKIDTIKFIIVSNNFTKADLYSMYSTIKRSGNKYWFKWVLLMNRRIGEDLALNLNQSSCEINTFVLLNGMYNAAKTKKWNHIFNRNPIAPQNKFLLDASTYLINNSTNTSRICLAASALDYGYDNTYSLMAYDRCKVLKGYSGCLDLAIELNDVDKIIDSLLLVKDVTVEQANAIIKPINSVEASYRKADILTALQNINSRCTIKLYDDHDTWEPVLAKVRAMIDVRK